MPITLDVNSLNLNHYLLQAEQTLAMNFIIYVPPEGSHLEMRVPMDVCGR